MENITLLQLDRNDLRNELYGLWKEISAEARKNAENEVKNLLLSADEVCKSLSISKPTLWRWGKAGKLIPIYVGGSRRYRSSDVQQLIDGLQ